MIVFWLSKSWIPSPRRKINILLCYIIIIIIIKDLQIHRPQLASTNRFYLQVNYIELFYFSLSLFSFLKLLAFILHFYTWD